MSRFHIARIFAVIVAVIVLISNGFADIPPDPGYTRVSTSIILSTEIELTDYRFFVVSSNLAKEIFLKKGEPTSVGSLGGGARYRGGSIVAIPVKSLLSFGDPKDNSRFAELEKAVTSGELQGRIELVRHSFATEVKTSEAGNVKDSSYRIDRTKDGLVAMPINGESKDRPTNGGGEFQITEVGKRFTPFGWATIIGGVFLTLGIAMIGLWTVKRRSRSI